MCQVHVQYVGLMEYFWILTWLIIVIIDENKHTTYFRFDQQHGMEYQYSPSFQRAGK